MKTRKLVVTTFYAGGKSVWIAERPVQMTDEEVSDTVKRLKEKGYGEVEAVTDTSGRFISINNEDFLREVIEEE
ncbi:MAG TPA: hypothetical protein DEA91_28815 [Paenibacillus sp.]|nr:hypothetical protein [Paenibacillus sp.]